MAEIKETKSLGDFLREVRKVKDLKQSDVARKMSIDPSVLCRYEKNQTRPSLESVGKLAEAYQLSKEEQEELGAILDLHTLRSKKTPQELQILAQLLMLPKELREKVIRAAIAYDSTSKGK